jgi:hypothetical protein
MTPVLGSVECTAYSDQADSSSDNGILLQEHQDYRIDYSAKTISFSYDLSNLHTLSLIYQNVGIFKTLEFQQIFFVDILSKTLEET